MYGILLRHLFLCCSSCVDHAIFIMAVVNIFLLGNKLLLISSDKYFESFFLVAKTYTAFRYTHSLSVAIF